MQFLVLESGIKFDTAVSNEMVPGKYDIEARVVRASCWTNAGSGMDLLCVPG